MNEHDGVNIQVFNYTISMIDEAFGVLHKYVKRIDSKVAWLSFGLCATSFATYRLAKSQRQTAKKLQEVQKKLYDIQKAVKYVEDEDA